MKKVWRKLYRQELLLEFFALAALIFLAGCVLIFLFVKALDQTAVPAPLVLGAAVVVFALILLAAGFFRRLSAAHIRCYKKILDSIPMPIIVTDENAQWQQINKAAREMMRLKQDDGIERLNSKHLIGADGGVTKKAVTQNGTEYRITGSRLDEGFLIILDNARRIQDTRKTRTEMIDEINKLLGQMSTVTDQFHGCASSFVGCTVQQAGIISELTSVITGIASGEYQEARALNEKMCAVKASIEKHIENNRANLETVRRTVKELNCARDSIGNALHNIDSVQ